MSLAAAGRREFPLQAEAEAHAACHIFRAQGFNLLPSSPAQHWMLLSHMSLTHMLHNFTLIPRTYLAAGGGRNAAAAGRAR